MTMDEIAAFFDGPGAENYFGEPVSVANHGLQAAYFAQACRAADALVVAALLHDIGHLLASAPGDVADWRSDAEHERVGAAWLAARFAPAVSEPVRLHVPAKRYLCATDAAYFAALSPASVLTLKLQGGPMPDDEVRAFEREPYFRDAVALRRWDDRAKIKGFPTPGLASHAPMIARLRIG